MTHPSIDARALVDDERYAAYKASLEEQRDKLHAAITDRHLDHPSMCRIAGELRGLNYALGLPEVLLASDPTSQTPSTP